MKRSRILVIADAAGSGHHYHAGDEAMAEVALERLENIIGRENIILACPHPRTAGTAYKVKAICMPMRTPKTWLLHLIINPFVTGFRIVRCLWHLSNSEFVFKAGGGNIRGKQTKFPLLSLARMMRKKLLVVSQTFGPFRGSHRSVLRKQLEEALWIGVRDRSYSGFQLGLPVQFALDDAVYLKPRHDLLTAGLIQNNPSMIGISFAECKGVDDEALNHLYLSIEALVNHWNAVAVFIPHHAPRGRSDCASARTVTKKWGNTQAILLDHVLPASAIMALTGGLRLVIANRYHGVIFGLTMGVPTIALYHDEYTEAKMRGAFEQFDLEPSVLSVTESGGLLFEMASAVMAERERFCAAAREAPAKLTSNMAPYELLRTLIGQPNKSL